jgi:hypothetical protein
MSLTRAGVVRCLRLPVAVLIALAVASPGLAQSTAPGQQGTVERVQVHGASLVGNLEGDVPDRDVFICLPPSYATSAAQRYPVVSLMPSFSAHLSFSTPG